MRGKSKDISNFVTKTENNSTVLDTEQLKVFVKEELVSLEAETGVDTANQLEIIVQNILSDDYVSNVLELNLVYQTAISLDTRLFEDYLLQQTLEIKPTNVYDTRESLERAGWSTIVHFLLVDLGLAVTKEATELTKSAEEEQAKAKLELENFLDQKGFFDTNSPTTKIKTLNGNISDVIQKAILVSLADQQRADISEIRTKVCNLLKLTVQDLQYELKCKRDLYWRKQISNNLYLLKKKGSVVYDSDYKNYCVAM